MSREHKETHNHEHNHEHNEVHSHHHGESCCCGKHKEEEHHHHDDHEHHDHCHCHDDHDHEDEGGCGCGCGIAYLNGGRFYEIAHTLVHSVAILSGTICDGAKSSCAAKIAMAVEAGILGYEMMASGHQVYGGDGIVTKGVDDTIANIGVLAKQGMQETDRVILKIMTTRCS